MDKNQIINQVITAVITILTTIIVVRLSSSHGTWGVTSKLKAMFTPKVRAYMNLIFAAGMCVWNAITLYNLVNDTSLPSRLEVFLMMFNFTAVLGFFYLTITNFGKLILLLDRERAERDKALLREYEERQLAALKPRLDRLAEKIRKVDEEIADPPDDKTPRTS